VPTAAVPDPVAPVALYPAVVAEINLPKEPVPDKTYLLANAYGGVLIPRRIIVCRRKLQKKRAVLPYSLLCAPNRI